jgi:phosphoglycolate phosphatase
MPARRHLFLDLDGTLTDPAPGIAACFLHSAHALGHTRLGEVDVRRFIGPPLREAFADILGTRDVARIEEAVRIYRERFSSIGLLENAVYPGIPELLARWCAAGHALSVVTSKAAVYAERIVDHFGLRPFLRRVYGAELSGERSTKAELVAHALASERLVAAEACMIGDREHDVLGARVPRAPSSCRIRRAPAARVRGTSNPARWGTLHSVLPLHWEEPGADFGFLLPAHGVAAIGVTWGYGSRAELEAAGADHIVDTLEALCTAVDALDASG